MNKYKLFIAVLLMFSISKMCSAAIPEYAKPIDAYQEKYDMSFFVWKPIGIHKKWYATYDGYPVTEIAKNQWVYGVYGNVGQLEESLIAVGSVDPSGVYMLTPLPPLLNDRLFNEEYKYSLSLKKIFATECDTFSIANTRTSHTPIAWQSGTSKVYMWGGKKWVKVSNRFGGNLKDAIKRDSRIVANMLKDCKIVWTQIDTLEFANHVRTAGLYWIDNFDADIPFVFSIMSEKNGGDGYNTGKKDSENGGPGEPGGPSGPSGPGDPGDSGNGGWDTGRDP